MISYAKTPFPFGFCGASASNVSADGMYMLSLNKVIPRLEVAYEQLSIHEKKQTVENSHGENYSI